jgi:tetratricopeptide (TPR) repeat protein
MSQKVFLLLFVFALLLFPSAVFSSQLTDEGIRQYRNESYEEALELFRSADKSEPSSLNSYYLGLSLKHTGSQDEALRQFKAAISKTPQEKLAAVEIIAMNLANGEDAEAATWIEWAEKEKVSPAEISFLKGELLFKKGDLKGAENSYRDAKNLDPDLSQQADLQIAQTRLSANDKEGARASLKAVIAHNPDNELAGFAREFELRIQEQLVPGPWRVSIGANYLYDENAVSKPNTEIAGVSFPKRFDSSSSQTLRVSYDLPSQSEWLLSGQYNFFNNSYFSLGEFSTQSHTLSLSPGYRFSTLAVTLPLTYNYSLLDYKIYSYEISARPTVTYALSPEHILQASAGYAKREFFVSPVVAAESRNAEIYSGQFGYIFLFANGRGFFNIKYDSSFEDTLGDNWDALINKLSIEMLIPLGRKTYIILSGETGRSNYPVNSFFGVKRNDTSLAASIGINRQLYEMLYLNAQYSHSTFYSNIALYEYRRNVYSAGLELRF